MSRSRTVEWRLVGQLGVLTAAMFAFGFALVPLYDVFCEITGLGGKTNDAPVVVTETPDLDRTVTIEFVTTVNEYAPWDFSPVARKVEVNPGKLYTAEFLATNLTGDARVGQAVPSVTPLAAASHFRKTECFCFTSQYFDGNEAKEMPVRFMVSTELPKHVNTITLSYTFFENTSVAAR